MLLIPSWTRYVSEECLEYGGLSWTVCNSLSRRFSKAIHRLRRLPDIDGNDDAMNIVLPL